MGFIKVVIDTDEDTSDVINAASTIFTCGLLGTKSTEEIEKERKQKDSRREVKRKRVVRYR